MDDRLGRTWKAVRSEVQLQRRENVAGLVLAAIYIAWIIGLLMGT